MDQAKVSFVVNSFYFCDPDGMSDYVASQEALPVDERMPQMKKLTFSHIICRNAHYTGVCIYGLLEQKVEEVVLKNVHLEGAEKELEWEGVDEIITR